MTTNVPVEKRYADDKILNVPVEKRNADMDFGWGASCTSNGATICSSCHIGFHGDTCEANVCACPSCLDSGIHHAVLFRIWRFVFMLYWGSLDNARSKYRYLKGPTCISVCRSYVCVCMYVCVEKRYADQILVKVPVEKRYADENIVKRSSREAVC